MIILCPRKKFAWKCGKITTVGPLQKGVMSQGILRGVATALPQHLTSLHVDTYEIVLMPLYAFLYP